MLKLALSKESIFPFSKIARDYILAFSRYNQFYGYFDSWPTSGRGKKKLLRDDLHNPGSENIGEDFILITMDNTVKFAQEFTGARD